MRATRRAWRWICAKTRTSARSPTGHVLSENYRPGTLEAMGFAPQSLRARNPRLLVVRISDLRLRPYRIVLDLARRSRG
ncbi:MAG: CoA transferase [Acetobacteraceae bacterium]|nr:CoA transferase [Acetobacteraceae bacterium]